jgi:hypothetical protein
MRTRNLNLTISGLIATLLFYPFPGTFIDARPHSILQQWRWDLDTVENGYWAGSVDRRWMLDARGWQVVEAIQTEIDAGRITPQTHIIHLADSSSIWTLAPISVYTGVNDDVIDFHYDPNNLFEIGGRVRGRDDLTARKRPAYIYYQRTGTLTFSP